MKNIAIVVVNAAECKLAPMEFASIAKSCDRDRLSLSNINFSFSYTAIFNQGKVGERIEYMLITKVVQDF